MIHIFIGNDYEARAKAFDTQRGRWQQKEYEILSFFSDETPAQEVINSLSHQTLFGEARAYVLHGYLTDEVIPKVIAEHVDLPIICIEDTLTAAHIKKITKTIGEDSCDVYTFAKTKEDDKAIFGLADSIRTRNPKNLWLTYQSLVDKGHTAHQMIGILWWQLKSMLLVQHSPNGHGLKPFVANKAKAALAHYPQDDLENKASELLDLYHRGHQDGMLENHLEEFLLNIGK